MLAPTDCLADAAAVARRNVTGCPSSSWQSLVADVVPRAAPVFVNVGANKGYSLVEFLATWTQRGASAGAWHKAILRYADLHKTKYLKQFGCGFCRDCRAPLPMPHSRTGGITHALELTSNNRQLLRTVAADAGLGPPLIRVHNYAASNVSGSMVYVPTFTGGETRSIRSATDRMCVRTSACTEHVTVITIDDFLREQRLSSIYHLAIDTEGYDALVLEGARETLGARRVAIVEFEVSKAGYWTQQSRSPLYGERRLLGTAVRRLETAGYSCFWQTSAGLVPLSGPCWLPSFEKIRTWSNVVCAHEAPVVATLARLARKRWVERTTRTAAASAAAPSRSRH